MLKGSLQRTEELIHLGETFYYNCTVVSNILPPISLVIKS